MGLIARELALALAASGREVWLVSPTFQEEQLLAGQPLIRRLRTPREQPGRARAANAVRSISRMICGTLLLLVARLKTRDFVISIPDPLPVALVNLAILRLSGARIHLMVHDPTPHAWRLPRLLRWLEKGAHELSYRLAHRLLVLSTPTAEALARHYPALQRPIRVVPHPVVTAGDTGDLPGEGRLFLFGTLRRNKNIAVSIEAIALARQQVPTMRLIVAGNVHRGDEGLAEELRSLAEAHPDAVELHIGYVSDEALADFVARVDAFLIPYRDFASQSGVALLAAGSARPMIATSSGGLGELMAEGMPAVPIQEPCDVDAIAEAALAFQAIPAQEWRDRCARFGTQCQGERSWQAAAAHIVQSVDQLALG